jgi:hypothetical protein
LEHVSQKSLDSIPDVETWPVVDIDDARAILDHPRLKKEDVVNMKKSNWEAPVTTSVEDNGSDG